MRNCLLCSIVTVMAVLVFWGVIAAKAQTATPTTPDLSGVWAKKTGSGNSFAADPKYPMQAWAKEKCDAVGCESSPNREDPRNAATDPVATRCAPHGFPRILSSAFYMVEIFQIPGRVFMHFEHPNTLRQIWTDGRGHPKEPQSLWMGHSIGKWDRDTLVVDTVNLQNDHIWLDNAGHPHTDALHVVERIRRVDQNTMQIDLTFDDPKAYTKPFSGQVVFKLMPEEIIKEDIRCEDRILADEPQDAYPFYIPR